MLYGNGNTVGWVTFSDMVAYYVKSWKNGEPLLFYTTNYYPLFRVVEQQEHATKRLQMLHGLIVGDSYACMLHSSEPLKKGSNGDTVE